MKEKHRVLERTKGRRPPAPGSPELPSPPLSPEMLLLVWELNTEEHKVRVVMSQTAATKLLFCLQTCQFLITETPQKDPYVKSKSLNIFKSSKNYRNNLFCHANQTVHFSKRKSRVQEI